MVAVLVATTIMFFPLEVLFDEVWLWLYTYFPPWVALYVPEDGPCVVELNLVWLAKVWFPVVPFPNVWLAAEWLLAVGNNHPSMMVKIVDFGRLLTVEAAALRMRRFRGICS